MGRIFSEHLYSKLQELDAEIFYGCGNEFKFNRNWWIIEDKGKIVAYCGCIYSEGICIFNRAWVHRKHRGKGIQRRMINTRLKAAKNYCHVAITYTTFDNIHSANNLIKTKFTLYNPSLAYAGKDKLYFTRALV